jgi:hypothetical protein
LKAGVLEEGEWTQSEVGAVQGGSISPFLANIYLYYVFDQWVHQGRKTQAKGDVIVIRYADDFIGGFPYRHEAERFLADNGSGTSDWNSIRTRQGFWSLAGLREITGDTAKKENRRHSTSWGSLISAG